MHTKERQTQNPNQQLEIHKTINQQQQNHRLRTDGILSYGSGGLNAFYWRQIVAIDSVVVVEIQKKRLAHMEAS